MSDQVRKAIEDVLHDDATLGALLGTPVSPFTKAIYARQAPSGADFPLIILNKQSGTRRWSFKGNPMREQIWQVRAVGHGASGKAEDIDERCEQILKDAALSLTSYANLYCRRETDIDFTEVTDGETYFHVGGEYRVTTERTS